MGASSIQVTLVSRLSAPAHVEQVPVVPPPVLPQKAPPPPPPAIVPKTITPSLPAAKPSKSPPSDTPKPQARPETLQTKPEPLPPKTAPSLDLAATLKKAEEALAKPVPAPVAKPLPSAPAPAPPSRASEDIKKLFETLPAPATPADAAPARKEQAPAVARVPQETAVAARPASLERCPPKARTYCPVLEAAINRVWNADTDPGIRRVLESAGDSTTVIRIVIQPDGEIRDIQLNKSSGNESYDRAVQSVLRALRRVPPLPEEMKGEPFVAVTSFTYTKKQDS
jgi:TonB family protein